MGWWPKTSRGPSSWPNSIGQVCLAFGSSRRVGTGRDDQELGQSATGCTAMPEGRPRRDGCPELVVAAG